MRESSGPGRDGRVKGAAMVSAVDAPLLFGGPPCGAVPRSLAAGGSVFACGASRVSLSPLPPKALGSCCRAGRWTGACTSSKGSASSSSSSASSFASLSANLEAMADMDCLLSFMLGISLVATGAAGSGSSGVGAAAGAGANAGAGAGALAVFAGAGFGALCAAYS